MWKDTKRLPTLFSKIRNFNGKLLVAKVASSLPLFGQLTVDYFIQIPKNFAVEILF